MWYQNICSALFGFLTKHASDRQIDGQTDRRTELR